MGGLTSKYLEEVLQTPPRSTHVLQSDPRSPSDDITRTPISVSSLLVLDDDVDVTWNRGIVSCIYIKMISLTQFIL